MDMYYIAIDGDNIGRFLESKILSEDELSIKIFSEQIRMLFDTLKLIAIENNLEILLIGGDSLLLKGNLSQTMTFLSKAVLFSNNYTFSIGLSKKLKGAYLALKEAKGLGRNRIVFNLCSNSKSLVISSEINFENFIN